MISGYILVILIKSIKSESTGVMGVPILGYADDICMVQPSLTD